MENRRFSLFWPILLIAVGLFLFMNNVGAITGSTWEVLLKLWPLILIVAGLDGIWRREGFVGSTVVIGLGVVFLMGNLGYLQFGVWELMLRLWPIFLVALGLDLMIGRKNPWSALVGVIIGVMATAGIVWLVLSSPLAVQLRTEPVAFPKDEVTSARGSIALPVGRLTVGSGANPNYLLDGQVALAGTQEVVKDYNKASIPLTFGLKVSGFSNLTPFGGSANREAWELMLNDKVSYELSLKTAVGEQKIDLGKLSVSSLECEIAVGKQVITLPASGTVQAVVRNAVGEVNIYIPRGTPVSIRVEKAVTALDIPADFTRSGHMIYSPGAETAATRSEVTIHNAVGRISVQVLP